MTYYNLSGLANKPTLYNLALEANSQAQGYIAVLILVVLFIIIFISLKNYETKRSFAAASFICAIVSILFNWIGFISLYYTIVLIIMTAGAAVMLIFEDG